MARKLTKLRVDEISLVPSAANPGARVMVYKSARGHDDSHLPQHERLRRKFASIDFSKLKLAPPNEPEDEEEPDDDEPDDTTALPEKLQQAIAALITAEPQFDRQSAAWYLLHTPHGRALTEHLSKRKDEPMNRTEDSATSPNNSASQSSPSTSSMTTTLTGSPSTS